MAEGEPQALFRVEPFGGLDLTSADNIIAKTTTPGNDTRDRATAGYNFVLNRTYGAFVTTQGRVRLLTLPLVSVTGLDEFSVIPSAPRYIAAGDSVALTPQVAQLFSFTSTGTQTQIMLPANVTLSTGQSWNFENYAQWAFGSNGTDAPIKIDSSLNVTLWGITAPSTSPSAGLVGGGSITTTFPLFYAVTFGNSTQESSPSALTGLTGVVPTAQNVALSNVPVSTDLQVTLRNIYRLGGDSGQAGQWIFVGAINDNTTTTFTDSTADGTLTGATLIQHRDPPQNFSALMEHKDRVWGLGYSGVAVGTTATPATSDVWYSNPYEPWGFDNTNQVIPVGRNAGDDVIVGGTPLGGVAMVLKRESFWAITGNSQADFFAEELFAIGCVSKGSIVYAQGQIFWLAEDSVYSFAGGSYTDIGILEKAFFFDGITDTDRAASMGAFRDQTYLLSFPTLGITMGFDLRSQEWVQFMFAFSEATWDSSGPGTTNPSVLLLGAEPNSGNIDQWFAAETDLGGSIRSSFSAAISDMGAPHIEKQFTHCAITIPVIPIPVSGPLPTALVQLVFTTNQGSATQAQWTETINLMTLPRYRTYFFELSTQLYGRSLQLQMNVTSTTMVEIDTITVYGLPMSRFVPTGTPVS